MLRPSLNQMMKPGENYYELVVAIAQKAREIATDAEENKIPLEVKPVNLAVDYFAQNVQNADYYENEQ